MGKTLTKTDETRQELTGAQYNAIAAMLSGATITAAAEVAGVQRQTVHVTVIRLLPARSQCGSGRSAAPDSA